MGIYYSGTKVYNNLSQHIQNVSDDIKRFEVQLKQFLQLHLWELPTAMDKHRVCCYNVNTHSYTNG
jgi:hypothetical protein